MFDIGRHARIKMQLHEIGISFADIAREVGVKRSSVCIVSQGRSTSHRIQTAIAGHLGLTAQDLFPERYRKETGQ